MALLELQVKEQAIFVAIMILLCLLNQGGGQLCSPNFANFSAPNIRHSPMLQSQLIIPSFSFPCAAVITQWEAMIRTGGRHHQMEVTRIEFQVWRLNKEQGKYHLVGNNSNTESTIRILEGRIVMEVDNPTHQIHVKPRDIVGLFVQGNGVEMNFVPSDTVHTYVADLDSPLERFDENIKQSDIFRRPPFEGTPMIRTLTGVLPEGSSTVPEASSVSSTLLNPSPTSSMMTLTTSITPTNMVIPAVEDEKEKEEEGKEVKGTRNQALIWGSVGGGMVVVILAGSVVVLCCVLVHKRKQCNMSTRHSNQNSTSSLKRHQNLSNSTAMMISTQDAKGSEAPVVSLTEMKDMGLETSIKTKKNASYSMLPDDATDGEIAGEEYHEYDVVPTLERTAQQLPSEYETPRTSIQVVQNIYEDINDGEDQIYEEIK